MTKSLSWSEKYLKIRSQSIELCKPLSVEDHLAQPIIDVSPPKWHLGHSTWFFETFILKPFNSNYKEFDPRFNFLFNSYYESVGKRVLRDQRANMTRPSLDKIYSYRQYIDREMEEFLNANPNPKALELLDLGLNHEQQHQELLVTDFKYILSSQAFFPVYQENYGEGKVENHQREWIKIPEGIYEIGFKGDGFCFDNELGLHKSYLHEYQISNKLVTNGEYLEFMAKGFI